MGKSGGRGNLDAFRPKPVEKVELSERNIVLRVIICAIFLVVAFVAFGKGINGLLSPETGWQTITADTASEANCSNEFVFMYNLGAGEMSATAENKALKIIYSDACVEAHQLFHHKELYDGVMNLAYINQNPNKEIEVDEALYEAFTLVKEYGSRYLYLAPVYAQYDEIYSCTDDAEIIQYDGLSNAEVAAYYKEVAAYINNAEMVDIQLLGNNKIKLFVSEEYLAFAEENGITSYIDFFWMRNAFIADYIAKALEEKGYTSGIISSYDGFTRNLNSTEEIFAQNIFGPAGDSVISTATMNYAGPMSIVCMRNFKVTEMDDICYYTLKNGEVRTPYLDLQEGLCKDATDVLYCYSEALTCAEIALQMASVYISEGLTADGLDGLAQEGIYSIYPLDNIVYYNEEDIVLTYLYDNEGVTYQKKSLNNN